MYDAKIIFERIETKDEIHLCLNVKIDERIDAINVNDILDDCISRIDSYLKIGTK